MVKWYAGAISEAEQLVYGMKDRNQTVEFILFDNEGHHTENMENIITMHKKTIEFCEQYLMEWIAKPRK